MIALLNSDARYLPLADQSVHCAITSPPYWGLRSYGVEPGVWDGDPGCAHEWVEAPPPGVPKRGNKPGDYSTSSLTNPERQDQVSRGTQSGQWCQHCDSWRGCLGLEPTPDLYVEHIVACMREVWRVLRDDGTLWLVLGDSYARNGGEPGGGNRELMHLEGKQKRMMSIPDNSGLKPKDLCMIPARVALALQADGWYLRADIIWSKTNPMPESVMDRPTKAHEYVFLLSKAERYYYDAEAIKEKAGKFHRPGLGSREIYDRDPAHVNRRNGKRPKRQGGDFSRKYAEQQPAHGAMNMARPEETGYRNRRTVWTVATQSYDGAHFATFPEKLIEPMILAGTSARGCCSACGAPWVRVVERITHFEGGSGKAGRSAKDVNERGKWSGKQYGENIKLGPVVESTTIGWRPSCACDAGDPIPCTVLDPFSGTATVGRVCARHGRRFVGGELNREYITLARERTSKVQMEMNT